MSVASPKPLLVVGAGIAGITTALEAAEFGQEVVLLEKEPSVGGRVLRNHQYFPKLCPPACGMEINTRRLEKNPRVRVLTQAQVSAAERDGDGWRVRGHARLKQTDFGIRPIRIAGGTVGVKDEVEVSLDLTLAPLRSR